MYSHLIIVSSYIEIEVCYIQTLNLVFKFVQQLILGQDGYVHTKKGTNLAVIVTITIPREQTYLSLGFREMTLDGAGWLLSDAGASGTSCCDM